MMMTFEDSIETIDVKTFILKFKNFKNVTNVTKIKRTFVNVE